MQLPLLSRRSDVIGEKGKVTPRSPIAQLLCPQNFLCVSHSLSLFLFLYNVALLIR